MTYKEQEYYNIIQMLLKLVRVCVLGTSVERGVNQRIAEIKTRLRDIHYN